MKILVATSDKYSFLTAPFSALFNKYWPNQEIHFLGFDKSSVPSLPKNCTFHSLGKQEDFGRIWTDPLIPFISELEDEHFVFTVEDVMLMKTVDQQKINTLEDQVVNHGASKAMLDSHLNGSAAPHSDPDSKILTLSQQSPYRASLHPAIWKKDYFLKFLKPRYTAWDFEIANDSEARNDGSKIVSLNSNDDTYYTCNVYRKGVPIPRHDCRRVYGTSGEYFDMEDIEYILKFVDSKVIL